MGVLIDFSHFRFSFMKTTASLWIKLQSQANQTCSLINYVVPKCWGAKTWPKVPVVLGERAQSKAVPSTFLPLLQRLQGWGTLGSSLQCKIGSLGPLLILR